MCKVSRIAALFLLLLGALDAQAFCSVSWAYFDARSNGPAFVRCEDAGETFTMWQQLDANGTPVWAHSTPAVSLDRTRLLSSLDWDNLEPQGFSTVHMPADKHVIVQLLASNVTLFLGTSQFPLDTHLVADSLDVVVGGSAASGSDSVITWSRTSFSGSTYEIGGTRPSGSSRLVRINGHDIFTAGFSFRGGFVSAPTRCDTCRDFDGTLTVIAGSGADTFYADARIGTTRVFGNEGDDWFHVFGVDHLGSLVVDAGSGGANTALLGSGGNSFGIQGPLQFDGGNCVDALYVTMEDTTDNTSRQVELSAQPGSGTVKGLSADVSFTCNTMLGVYPTWFELHAGPKSDIFRIDGLFAQETHIDGIDGDDSVQFTLRHDTTSGGPLYLKNTKGSIGIEVDDRGSSIPIGVELRKDYAYVTDRNTHDRLAWVIWNTPDATDVSNVTLRLGDAANDVAIFGVPDAVNYFIYGGKGGMTVNLAGDKVGQGSSVALGGGDGRDVFTVTPVASGSGLISVDGGGEPAGCGPQASPCGDVLNYLGLASGAVPTTGVLVPPPGDLSNVVFFSSIEAFDGIFKGCFESGACTP